MTLNTELFAEFARSVVFIIYILHSAREYVSSSDGMKALLGLFEA